MTAAVLGLLSVVKIALSIPLLGFLPGYSILRWVDPRTRRRSGFGSLERILAAVTVSVALTSLVALLLAQAGHLDAGLLAIILAAVSAVAWKQAPARAAARAADLGDLADRAAGRHAAVMLGVVIVAATLLFTPPFQTTLWGGDSSLYVGYGAQIGRSGAYAFADPLVSGIPLETREELFRNQSEKDMTGRYARFPGGIGFVDMAGGRVAPGFSPLFPVWLAIFAQLFGSTQVFWAVSVFGVGGVVALFALGRSLHGPQAGLLAASWLMVCLPQIWFSRMPMSETLAQFFVLGGLWMTLSYVASEDRILGVLSGSTLAVAGLAGFDVVVTTTAGILAFAACVLLGGRRIAHARYFLAGYGAVAVYGLAHLAHYPSNYGAFFQERLPRLPYGGAILDVLATGSPSIWLMLVVVVVVVAAVCLGALMRRLFPGRQTRDRVVGAALALGLALYLAGYGLASKPRYYDALRWFPAYLSWPLLILFLLALSGILWRRLVDARDGDTAALLAGFAVATIPVLYNPQLQDFGVHPGTMRRFVPFLIPGICVIAAAGFVWFVQRLSLAARRITLPLGAALVLALVAQPGTVLVGQRLWNNGVVESNELAAMFPAGAVVLVSPELAGLQAQAALTFWHERESLALSPTYAVERLVEDQVARWLAGGRSVFLLSATEDLHFDGPSLSLAEHGRDEIVIRTLAESSWLPYRIEARTVRVSAYRFGLEASPKSQVDVGAYTSDAMFPLTGFYGPETDASAGSYRWTGAVATIRIPAARRVTLLLRGARPPGLSPAVVSLRANGERLVSDATIPDEPTRLTIALADIDAGESLTITLESSTFNPRYVGLSNDHRDLGVRLYHVAFER